MRILLRFALVLLAPSLAFANAKAQTAAPAPAVAKFEVGGIRLQVTVPPGFCVLDDEHLEVLRKKSDNANILHLVLNTCGDPELHGDYYAVMTPANMVSLSFQRPAFLSSVKAQFSQPGAQQEFDSLLDDTFDKAGARQGRRYEHAGTLSPLGVDTICAYLGGAISLRTAEGGRDAVLGGCMTVVSGKVVSIYSSGLGTTNDDVVRHVRASRAMALSITSAGP